MFIAALGQLSPLRWPYLSVLIKLYRNQRLFLYFAFNSKHTQKRKPRTNEQIGRWMDKQTAIQFCHLFLQLISLCNNGPPMHYIDIRRTGEKILFFITHHFLFFFFFFFTEKQGGVLCFVILFIFQLCNKQANWGYYEKEIIRKLIYQLLILSQQIDRVSLTIYYGGYLMTVSFIIIIIIVICTVVFIGW